MKKSISYWSFPGGLRGEKDPVEAALEARAAGFQGIELALGATGYLTLELSDDKIEAMGDQVRRAGVEISALACAMLFEISPTSDDRSVRERAKEITARQLEMARLLGTDATLVIPGGVDVFFLPDAPVVDYEDAWERIRIFLRELAPVAERNKVHLGVENVWNKFLLSPLEFRSLLDEIGSPFVGAYLDVGNVMLTGYPEQWIRILDRRIRRVHLKDFRRSVGNIHGFVDLLAGDVNWPAVVSALKRIGYDGYVTAEMIPPSPHHPRATLEITSRAMDHIFGSEVR